MKNLTILIVMVIAIQTVAQIPTPDFLFTLRATNALGHKDSAVIGTYYRSENTPNLGHPILGLDGPQLIGTAADSNMELRVKYTPMWENPYHTNKVIVPTRCPRFVDNLMNFENQILILVTAKKWPVTFSWDSTLFVVDTCKRMSFFSFTNTVQDGLSWIDLETYTGKICMAARNRRLIIDSVTTGSSYGWIWDNVFTGVEKNILLNNGKIGKQYSISLYFNKSLQRRGVNIHKPKTPSPMQLYPNPVADQLTIKQPEMGSSFVYLKIYTMQGKTVQQHPLTQGSKSHVVRLSGLKAGMYLVEIRDKEGRMYREKFVKR